MAFKKGHKKTGGRKAGTKNKTTQCMREAWTLAFDKIGGAEALADWAQKNRTDFYKLASKLIPQQITGDKDNPVIVELQNAAASVKEKFDRIIKSRAASSD